MDLMTLFYVVVYFTVGWFLSDWLNTEGSDELAVFIFVFWPLIIAFIGMIVVMGLAAILAALISKLIGFTCSERIESSEGGDSDGAV